MLEPVVRYLSYCEWKTILQCPIRRPRLTTTSELRRVVAIKQHTNIEFGMALLNCYHLGTVRVREETFCLYIDLCTVLVCNDEVWVVLLDFGIL